MLTHIKFNNIKRCSMRNVTTKHMMNLKFSNDIPISEITDDVVNIFGDSKCEVTRIISNEKLPIATKEMWNVPIITNRYKIEEQINYTSAKNNEQSVDAVVVGGDRFWNDMDIYSSMGVCDNWTHNIHDNNNDMYNNYGNFPSESSLLGMRIKDVKNMYPGIIIRVLKRNGNALRDTNKMNPNRINVATKNDIITEILSYH